MSDMFGGLVILSAGTLYPAYSSYKAVKTKNTREYVKWMMYWIVFAFFNAITMFTDVFVSWFPGYYLFKTLFIIWLVSPATRVRCCSFVNPGSCCFRSLIMVCNFLAGFDLSLQESTPPNPAAKRREDRQCDREHQGSRL